MESQPIPLRLRRLADRAGPEPPDDPACPPSSGELHRPQNFPSPVLPVQSAARPIEGPEMFRESAEDISQRIRQDGVRHLLTGRTAGNSAEYGFGGSAFVGSLTLGAGIFRMNQVR